MMSRHCFLDNFLEERLYEIQPEGFVNPGKMLTSMESSSNPSKDWSKHLGVGMYTLMR